MSEPEVIDADETQEVWSSREGGTTLERTTLYIAHDEDNLPSRHEVERLASDYLANALGYVGRITSVVYVEEHESYYPRPVAKYDVSVEKEW